MADETDVVSPDEEHDDGASRTGFVVSVAILVAYVVLWFVDRGSDAVVVTLLKLLAEVGLISVVIWQVCDPFADAAQWIGTTFRLPGSVRGATLDAVASSMPELFTGIFFVVLAVTAADGADAQVAAGAEGFGSTIATCAGSAVYNMVLIPAFCTLVISSSRPSRPTIDVEDEVLSRDGAWFVGCELLLIAFLFNEQMSWWMAVVFIGVYGCYIVTLYRHALDHRRTLDRLESHFETHGNSVSVDSVVERLSADGIKVSRSLVAEVQASAVSRASLSDEDEEPPDTAGVFFGYFDVPLGHGTVWSIIAVATLIAAAACYFLVEATRSTADLLAVPTFFVAVIVAAAASSVPDTFLAIAAARRGDDSGAVSNAFGSNIFDICICISIPLLVNSYLNGWQPVSLMDDGKPMQGLVGLQILLVVTTLVTLAVMWHKRQLTRGKAYVLCGLYALFIGYAVLGSLGLLD